MKLLKSLRLPALLTVIVCLLATAALADAEGCATVTASALRMRSSASTSSSVVTTVSSGTVVLVTEKGDDWHKVWYNGHSGYMSAEYLNWSESGTADFGTGKINASGVNIREEANTSSDIVATVNAGETMPITGVLGRWYKVKYDGDTAYVRSDFLDISAGSSSSSSSGSSSSSSDKTGEINASYVRLRAGASTSSQILFTLQKGAEMTVTGTDGDWYAVSYNGTKGYVYKQYLTVEGESSSGSGSSQDGYINASAVRLRGGASTSSTILDTLSKNTTLTVKDSSGDWYAVTCNGTDGYVYKQYVSLGSPSSSGSDVSVSSVSEDTGYIKGYYVRVRTAPSTSASIIVSLNTGEKLSVTGQTDSWYQVKYNGQTGYVYKSYLSLGEPASTSTSATASSKAQAIVDEAKKYLGVPYVWGGTSPSGFDCSGLVYYVFQQHGYGLYRTAGSQYRNGTAVGRSELQAGDIICFYNGSMSSIGHVGIYIGGGEFIHASSGSGKVVISKLSQTYYDSHYYGARRIVS